MAPVWIGDNSNEPKRWTNWHIGVGGVPKRVLRAHQGNTSNVPKLFYAGLQGFYTIFDDVLYSINVEDATDFTGIFGAVGNLPTALENRPRASAIDTSGDLYVAQQNGTLWRINIQNPSDESGDYGLVGSFPSQMDIPEGMDFMPDGNLLVGDNQDDLWIINPSNPSDTSGDYGEVSSGGGYTNIDGIAVTDSGIIYIVDGRQTFAQQDKFYIVTLNPFSSTFLGDLPVSGDTITGITIDNINDDLIVMVGDSLTITNIWRINPNNTLDESGDYGNKGRLPAPITRAATIAGT